MISNGESFQSYVPSNCFGSTRTPEYKLTLLLFFFFCSDYINPIDLCNRLNAYIIPEAAVHAFLTFLFVINGYWLAIVLNLPLVLFNAKKYVGSSQSSRKPPSDKANRVVFKKYRIYENQHLLDATEIFRKLNVHKKVGLVF